MALVNMRGLKKATFKQLTNGSGWKLKEKGRLWFLSMQGLYSITGFFILICRG